METSQETFKGESINGAYNWKEFKFDAPFTFDSSLLMEQHLTVYSSQGKEVIKIEAGLRDVLGERNIHLVITKDNIEKILESLK